MKSTATNPTASLSAAVMIAKAVYEAIAASGSQGVPSGHLYAMLMGKMDLAGYESLIGLLKRSGLVTETDHVLRANASGAPQVEPSSLRRVVDGVA